MSLFMHSENLKIIAQSLFYISRSVHLGENCAPYDKLIMVCFSFDKSLGVFTHFPESWYLLANL